MREIKFRGQRVDNGQWIYGYYVYRPDGKHFIWSINISYEVHPETVGQFTGLQDKNGVDVYELSEINNKYIVVYMFNRYVLNDISNSDIFVELKNNESYEITRDYAQV